MTAWVDELQRQGVEEVVSVTPVRDLTALNQMLRLGFHPARLVTMGEESPSSAPGASSPEATEEPPAFAEGLPESAMRRRGIDLAPTVAAKRPPEDSQGPTTAAQYIGWQLPLPYDNGPSTYMLERSGELREAFNP